MSETVELKMVRGATYASPLFAQGNITRGETVSLPVAAAKELLKDGYSDPSGNFHRYFTQVSGPKIAVEDGDVDELPGNDEDAASTSGTSGKATDTAETKTAAPAAPAAKKRTR